MNYTNIRSSRYCHLEHSLGDVDPFLIKTSLVIKSPPGGVSSFLDLERKKPFSRRGHVKSQVVALQTLHSLGGV